MNFNKNIFRELITMSVRIWCSLIEFKGSVGRFTPDWCHNTLLSVIRDLKTW